MSPLYLIAISARFLFGLLTPARKENPIFSLSENPLKSTKHLIYQKGLRHGHFLRGSIRVDFILTICGFKMGKVSNVLAVCNIVRF